MGMKMREVEYGAPAKQILAIPDHYVALGFKHPIAASGSEGLAVLVDGHYIVKAGTIYPANDATAIGVVLNDYDVTYGDAMMAVVMHGFIKTAALPAAPSADTPASQSGTTPFAYTAAVPGAKTALTLRGIVFVDAVVQSKGGKEK